MIPIRMAADPDLDDLLRDFLRRENDDPVRTHLARQFDWMQRHEALDNQRHTEIMRNLDAHGYRLKTLESEQNRLDRVVEDTGRHEIESLRARARWPAMVGRRALERVVLVVAAATAAGSWRELWRWIVGR